MCDTSEWCFHNVKKVLYKTWSVAWGAKPAGMLIRDWVTWRGMQLVQTCLCGLLEIVPCTDFPTVPKAVEASGHWQSAKLHQWVHGASKVLSTLTCAGCYCTVQIPSVQLWSVNQNHGRKAISLGNHSAGSGGWGWQGEVKVAPGILGKGTLECRVRNEGVQGNGCEERDRGRGWQIQANCGVDREREGLLSRKQRAYSSAKRIVCKNHCTNKWQTSACPLREAALLSI